jgi:predicted ABC-type ATPase
LAEERVRKRVAAGGHDIPSDVIHRRYRGGIRNLFSIFIPLVDYWVIIDSSNPVPSKIAEAKKNAAPVIFDSRIFDQIASYEG